MQFQRFYFTGNDESTTSRTRSILDKKRINHGFHMVSRSPWPLFVSFSALFLTIGLTGYMHRYLNGGLLLIIGFSLFLFILILWWRDVIREATFEGKHTS